MERLIEMLAVLAFLYIGYTLGLKRWSYAPTQADLEKRRTELKAKGLCNTFYFIHAGTLFFLILFSGGTFVLYWMFQQWTAVVRGFKRSDGLPLRHGPLLRTLAGSITFFSLANIINHTCEYMRKKSAWPAGWWGSVWVGGFILALMPLGILARSVGFFLFCLPPVALQHRLNALPKTRLPARPKVKEFVAAALGLTVLAGMIILLHTFFQ